MQLKIKGNLILVLAFAGLFLLGFILPCHVVRAQDGEPDDDHDHDHDEDHLEPGVEIIRIFDLDNDTFLNDEEFHAFYDVVFPEAHEHEENGTDDHDHDHDHRRRLQVATDNRKAFVRAASVIFTERQSQQLSTSANNNNSKKRHSARQAVVLECHPADELFAEFDFDADGFLNATEVEAMAPELLLMIVQGVCAAEHGGGSECEEPESWEAWLSTLASVIIITLLTLVGIVFVPFLARWKKVHERVIMVLISFASGALIGDAIYHLIPIAVELHSHDETEGGHDHGGHEEEHDDSKDYLGPLTLVIVGILVFYIIEALLYWVLGEGHSHLDDINKLAETDKDKDKVGSSSDSDEVDENDVEMSDKSSDNSSPESSTIREVIAEHGRVKGSVIVVRKGAKNQVKRLKFVKTFGWLNLLADVFHNFVDGLAIGVAYSNSLALGLSTTIAVALHEIPQELGDYGILINAGFGPCLALLFNLLSGGFAILGGIIGVGVGDNAEDADKWILAFTAGGFLYIAMVNMFHEMHKMTRVKNWWGLLDIALQIFAMLVGFAILVVIAVYEDDIMGC